MHINTLLAIVTLGVSLCGCLPLPAHSADRVKQTTEGAQANYTSGLSKLCASVYPNGWVPVQGKDRAQPVAGAKPPRGKAFPDSIYKSCIVRLTDHSADGLKTFARVDYSRRQAFNANSTRVIVGAYDGSWHVYDTKEYRHVKQLPGIGGDAEPQWHPANPDLLYYFPPFGIGMEIRSLNVETGQTSTVARLASRLKSIWPAAHAAWTKSEGSPSADGRYWALQVDDANWKGLGIVSYDLANDRILGSYDLKKHGKQRPDHVSMSPSGNYIVVSFDGGPCSYNRDLTGERQIAGKGEHSDIALDARGDDVYVSINYESRGGQVYMYNLRTGVRTDLFPTYIDHTATAMHFSGKAFKKPGWVLISTYRYSGTPQWLTQKIFAVQLQDNPVIYNLAHHHEVFTTDATYGGYFTEPHATVNNDFTRVIFNSNWDIKSAMDIDAYMAELPRDAIR